MLAIVIPFYKITFFEETLQSLADQTDKRFKVYIGNDGSPETPTNLLKKYKGQFDFVYHRFETNLGGTSLTQQWERCIALTEAEKWIMILGDDDVLQDNFVAAFYENRNKIETLKINVIRYATEVINDKGKVISKQYIHPKLEKSTDFLMRKLKGGTRSSLSEFVFRRADFDKVKFKDLPLAWYSDYLAVLEVSNFSLLYTINDSLVYFRLSGLNITSKNNNLKIKNIATFRFYYYLLHDKKHFFDSKQQAVLRTTLEKTFLDNKKNVYFWLNFTKLYFTSFYFKQYLIFMFNVIQAICKKIKNT